MLFYSLNNSPQFYSVESLYFKSLDPMKDEGRLHPQSALDSLHPDNDPGRGVIDMVPGDRYSCIITNMISVGTPMTNHMPNEFPVVCLKGCWSTICDVDWTTVIPARCSQHLDF